MNSLVSFLSENIFIIAITVIAILSFVVRFRHRNKALFEIKGDIVIINPTPALKFSFETKQSIKIDSVVKIEKVENRLSFFQRNDNAIDVWVQHQHLDNEINNVKKIFVNAEFIEIGS